MDLAEEKQIIERARTDPRAFGILYDLYYPKISNYLLHRLPRTEIAADITSEVFFKAMTKLHRFSWRDISFAAWLYKIANNEIKMYYRKKERKFFSLDFLFDHFSLEFQDTTDIEQDYIAAEEVLSRDKRLRELQRQLWELPLLYQEVLVLKYFERKSLAEISEITGKNINTIKSLILRGKEKLRNSMTQPDGGEF